MEIKLLCLFSPFPEAVIPLIKSLVTYKHISTEIFVGNIDEMSDTQEHAFNISMQNYLFCCFQILIRWSVNFGKHYFL